MKIIEAMKEIQRLQEKVSDLKAKVTLYCADLDFETAPYGDHMGGQEGQITEWLQSSMDSVQRIAELRVAISRTNLATNVPIELGGRSVIKSIAEWIHRRRDLAKLDEDLWKALTDRNLREGPAQQSQGQIVPVKIRRYFAPTVRDQKVSMYHQEPSLIDATLEVVNAVTDLAL